MARLARRATTRPLLLFLLLASFALILGCTILVGELLKLSERPNGSTAFDSSITAWLVAHRTHGLTMLARLLSFLGSQKVLAPAAGVVVVLLLVRRRAGLAGVLVASWGGALLLYTVTKYIVDRPRPPMQIWLASVGSSSFPSGHATQSVATLAALAVVAAACVDRSRGAGIVLAMVLAAGVGWSRVYLGVHWSTDVISGWLLGAAWVAAVCRRRDSPSAPSSAMGDAPDALD